MSHNKLSYLAWNFSHIDADFNFNSGLLAFDPLPANHDADRLRVVLAVRHTHPPLLPPPPLPLLKGIRNRLVAQMPSVSLSGANPRHYFNSDGAGNFQNALIAEGYPWIWCYCHRLHLAVQFALGDSTVQRIVMADGEEEVLAEGDGPAGFVLPVDIRDLISKFRFNINTIKSRAPLVEFIMERDLEQQAQGHHVHPLRLARNVLKDVPNRWTAFDGAVVRVGILQHPIQQSYISPRFSELFPLEQRLTDGDFHALQALHVLLEPASTAVTLLSSSSEPTWGFGIYSEYKLKQLIVEDLAQHPIAVQLTVRFFFPFSVSHFNQFLRRFKASMDYYFKRADQLLSNDELLAVLLDPRTKKRLAVFQYREPGLTSATGRALSQLREAITRFPPPPIPGAAPDAAAEPVIAKPAKKKSRLEGDVVHVKDEAARFLDEEGISPMESAMAWWRVKKDEYPSLARVARYYLAIPGSSVMSESTNSEAAFIVDKHRAALVPASVATLVQLHRNLRGVDPETLRI